MNKNIILLSTVVLILLILLPGAAFAAVDLSRPSGLSAGDFEALMPEAFQGYGGIFYDSEQNYGINGIFLLAVIRLESGNGESWLSQNSNNVAGNKGEDGYLSFDVLSEGIVYAASNLGENYLREDGKFYSGGTLEDIARVYCPGGNWASQVKNLMAEYGY